MSTVRMSELLEQARSFDSSKLKPQTTSWAPLQEGVNEAVSPEQQAAIAISKKNKSKNKDEETEIEESGHTDVASAITNVKVAMSALTKMSGELSKLSPEDSLPSWWTNKVAVAVDKLDGMADYLDAKVESVKLDELVPTSRHVGKSKKNKDMFAVFDTNGEEVKLFKDEDDAREYSLKNHDKLMGHDKKPFKKEEVEPDTMNPRDHVAKSKKNPDMFCVFDTKGNEVKLFKDKKDAEEFAAKNHDMLMGRESKKEEVKLDELMPPSRHVGKSEKNPDMFAVYDQKGKEVKLFKDEGDAKEYATKNHEALMGHDKPKKEESDLDEAMLIGRDYEYDEKEGVVKISKKNFTKVKKDYKGTDKSKPTMMVLTKKGTSLVPVKFTEEVELDEALKTTHVIVDTAQGNMVISSAAGGNAEKNLQSSIASAERPPLSIKDKKTLKIVKLKKPVSQKKADDLMGQPLKEEVEESYEYGTDEYAKHTRDVTPGQGKEIDEARPSARRDAMKAMGKRKSDSADDDDYVATADDRKAADKNIIMQLRKATNLGGKYEVEFKDKKKIKVKPAIAMAFIKKYEKMKPVDKAKLQDKGSKSYKDLLKGLKEEDTSMLGRIEKKLKEIRNG